MKHNYLTFVLTMLMSMAASMASAHDFEVDGIYYKITSSISHTVEVTYRGNSYSSYDNEYTGSVTIPESVYYNSTFYSVTSIGSEAFKGCSGLTSVTIPNSVTYISSYAFEGCSGLNSVTIPNSVTSIGNNAFSSCSGLTSVTIPNSVTSIGSYAFEGCSGLTSVTIPNSVTSIGWYAFQNCSGLESIVVNSGNTVYDSREGCNAIIETASNSLITGCRNTIIPNSVTKISDRAFYGSSSLTSVTIPNSVTSIGDYAFLGCSGLTSVTIPNSVTSIRSYAFSGCISLTRAEFANIEHYLTGISFNGGFASAANPLYYAHHLYIDGREVTDLIIPNSVTSIGGSAFSGCSGLTSVTIPNSVTSIDGSAFYGCTGLTSITIPNSVTSIGNSAFEECTGLTSITIPNSVTSIGKSAFQGCSGLTSVTIPNSVTSIGNIAFNDCTGLKNLVFEDGESQLSLGYNSSNEGLFYDCPLKTLYLGRDISYNSDSRYGYSPFYGNTTLTSATIGNSVTTIGRYEFNGCSGLTSVTIPNSVTSIGHSAFSGCSGLETIVVNSDNTIYDSREGCNAIIETASNTLIVGCKNTTIPNSVTSIGNNAFYNCSGLTSITIPNCLTAIGSNAFSGCLLRNLMIKCPTPPSSGENTFSPQTYYHTTLYVPMDAWDAYAYDSNWYQFINIRETAMSEEEVNTDRAYTLMNAKTFTYAVYDPVNDCIGSIKSIGALDENNPNHSWQTLDVKGQKYLYNIGARRFAVPTNDGTGLRLLDNADSITMTDNEDGIVLNGHAETPWALVSNERMSIDKNAEENLTGLKAIDNEQLTIDNVYDLSGRQQGKMQRGVNLLRMSDGTTKKVLVK